MGYWWKWWLHHENCDRSHAHRRDERVAGGWAAVGGAGVRCLAAVCLARWRWCCQSGISHWCIAWFYPTPKLDIVTVWPAPAPATLCTTGWRLHCVAAARHQSDWSHVTWLPGTMDWSQKYSLICQWRRCGKNILPPKLNMNSLKIMWKNTQK